MRIEASYLAHEAARLVGVSGDRIGQWSRWGHIRASVSDGDPHVYSWEDVAEAIAVHELLERGLRLPAIRATVERYGGPAARPLSSGGLELVGLLPLNGHVPAPELLRRGGWAARVLPDLFWVEVDPARMNGRPCIRGRRVLVQQVAALAAEPLGAELLAEEYGLTLEQIDDATRWWAEAHRFEEGSA